MRSAQHTRVDRAGAAGRAAGSPADRRRPARCTALTAGRALAHL